MYIDTHLDTFWHIKHSKRSFARYEGHGGGDTKIPLAPGFSMPKHGHVDLPRAREGELCIGFFTGFPTSNHYATEQMIREWLYHTSQPENHLFRIKNKTHLEKHIPLWNKTPKKEKNIGAVMCLEGAAGIDTELNRLYIYHDLGLRSMGITWNEQNQFATGVLGDKNRGFTKEGLDLLSAMEDLGIIIDVSHLNDKSFWDAVNNTNAPLIASHSNLRSIADHPRNLTEEMAIAIKETNGTIGVNFHSGFLSTNKEEKPTIDFIVKMIKRIIEIVGIDHVHIGSDFDGSTPPKDIRDVSVMPVVFQQIQNSLGLTNQELEKIKNGNILRVIRNVWKK